MHYRGRMLPPLTHKISKREKGGHPDCRSAICKPCELPILQVRDASHQGGEMARSRNEIADGKNPSANAVKPARHTMETLRGEVDIFAIAMDCFSSEFASDEVAQRNSAAASEKTGQESQIRMQPSLPDEIAAEDK